MNLTVSESNKITNSLSSFFSLVDYSESSGTDLVDELASHSHPYFSIIERLQQSMVISGTDHKTYALWLNFYADYQNNSIDPVQKLKSYNQFRDSFEQMRQNTASGEFAGTGLWLVDDDYPGVLLSHQMRNGDFQRMVQDLYFPILGLIECDDPALFANIRKDLRMILCKPSGRDLVRSILNLNSFRSTPIRIEIVKGNQFAFHYGMAPMYSISYQSEKTTTTVHHVPALGHLSLYSPNFITLFHELTHLKNHLSSAPDYALLAQTPDNLYTDLEEFRTIREENDILEEYLMPVREFHIEGQNSSKNPSENLTHAVKFRLMGDLYREVQLKPDEASQQVKRVLQTHPGDAANDSSLSDLFEVGGVNIISPLRPLKRRKDNQPPKNPVTLFSNSPRPQPLPLPRPLSSEELLETLAKRDCDPIEMPPLEPLSPFELEIPPLEPPTPPEEEITTSYQGTTEKPVYTPGEDLDG